MRVPRVLDWMFLPTRVSRAVEVQLTAVEVEMFGGVGVDVGLVGAGQVGGRLLFALIPPVARLPSITGTAAVALLAALPGQCFQPIPQALSRPIRPLFHTLSIPTRNFWA